MIRCTKKGCAEYNIPTNYVTFIKSHANVHFPDQSQCVLQCGQKIRLNQLEEHLKSCPNELYKCQECGGKIILPHDDCRKKEKNLEELNKYLLEENERLKAQEEKLNMKCEAMKKVAARLKKENEDLKEKMAEEKGQDF